MTMPGEAVNMQYPSPASITMPQQLHVEAVVLRLAWLSPKRKVAATPACHAMYRDTREGICTGLRGF